MRCFFIKFVHLDKLSELLKKCIILGVNSFANSTISISINPKVVCTNFKLVNDSQLTNSFSCLLASLINVSGIKASLAVPLLL